MIFTNFLFESSRSEESHPLNLHCSHVADYYYHLHQLDQAESLRQTKLAMLEIQNEPDFYENLNYLTIPDLS